MSRILVLGCSGTGKSTFARQVGERLGIPVIFMDTLFWNPGWIQADPVTFVDRVQAAHAGDHWVSEGNYIKSTLDSRYAAADQILWLDQPRALRVWRILKRTLGNLGRSRPGMVEGCVERINRDFLKFLKMTWDFDRSDRPAIQRTLNERFPGKEVIALRGDRAIAGWLSGLPIKSTDELR